MIFPPFTNLTTERLFLRELQPGDAEEIFRLRSDETVSALIDRPVALNIDDAHNFIQRISSISEKNEVVLWAITKIGDPKLIGTVLYWNIEPENNKVELGYELLPENQGKGIMSEALEKVIAFGFEEMKLNTIVACPNPKNGRSVNVLIRTGFKNTGELQGDYAVYELHSKK